MPVSKFTPGCECCGGPCRVGLINVHNCCSQRTDCGGEDFEAGEACLLGVWNSLLVTMGFECGAVVASLDTCLLWTSGRTFTGTGGAGDEWSVTLAESDCSDDTITVVESATVTLDGITVTWTRANGCVGAHNNGDLALSYGCYDVSVSPNDDCPEWCPTFDAQLRAWPRNWEDFGDAPATITVTLGGFTGSVFPDLDPCCVALNGAHTLNLVAWDATSCTASLEDGGSGYWESFEVFPTDGCHKVVRLTISSTNESPCSIAIELSTYAILYAGGVQVASCQTDFRGFFCLSPSQTFDLSELADWNCDLEGCCSGTFTIAGTIPT